MVADEDDDRVLVEPLPLQFGEHQAELCVHEGHRGEVGLLGRALRVFGHAVVGHGRIGQGDLRFRGAVRGGVGDELDLILGVVPEIGFRSHVGRVGAEEADRQEEGLGPLLLEETDGLRGDLAVGLLGVGAVGREPAQRPAVVARPDEDLPHVALGLVGGTAGADTDREDLVLVVAVAAAGVPDLLPGLRVVETVGADLLGHAVMVKLADAGDRVAVVLEELRHGHHVRDDFPEFLRVVIDPRGVRAQAGEERRAARIAESVLAVGTVEADARAGEGVDVRRQRRSAIGAHPRAAVVGDEEQDVLPRGREDGQATEDQDDGRGEAHGTHLGDKGAVGQGVHRGRARGRGRARARASGGRKQEGLGLVS